MAVVIAAPALGPSLLVPAAGKCTCSAFSLHSSLILLYSDVFLNIVQLFVLAHITLSFITSPSLPVSCKWYFWSDGVSWTSIIVIPPVPILVAYNPLTHPI